MERALESLERGLISLGLDLDPTVFEVPDKAAEPLAHGRLTGKESEPHTLHAACDQKLSNSNHLVPCHRDSLHMTDAESGRSRCDAGLSPRVAGVLARGGGAYRQRQIISESPVASAPLQYGAGA